MYAARVGSPELVEEEALSEWVGFRWLSDGTSSMAWTEIVVLACTVLKDYHLP